MRVARFRFLTSVAFFALTLQFAPMASSADWARFRGPNGSGVSDDDGVPTTWSDTENLLWKVELPGKGYSSPIVVGDRVFVTCYSNIEGGLEELKRHLVCVNRKTGDTVWSKEVPSTAAEKPIPFFAGRPGYSSHTPVSDGEHVYAFFGSTGVVAFDLIGNEVWRQEVGSEGRAMFGSASSPILYKDRVIVTAGSESESVKALDKKSGKELWSVDASALAQSYATPIVATNERGEDELLLPVAFEIWSLNPESGKLRWYAETKFDTAACPSLVQDGGIVYGIGGRGGGRAAVRLGGKKDVSESHLVWSQSGGAYVPSPVLHGDHMYWVNDRGIVNCVDKKTGESVAQKRLRAQFYASITRIKDRLYAVSRFGGTYVLEATPELEQVALNKVSDESDFSASPAVSNGQLFLRSDIALYCIASK